VGDPDAPSQPGRKPQRILLVSANFRPSVGGIERFVETLAQGLASRGWEVVVLCCRHGNAPLVEDAGGVRVVRIPASHILARRSNVAYPLPSPLPLARALGRLLPWAEIVHVQDALYLTSAATLAAARRREVPTVLTQHAPFVPQASRALDLVQRIAVTTVGRSARLATRVVAFNASVSEWAASTWGLADVPILPIGVAAPDAGGADRATLRREFGLPENRFLALFVGRDVPTKRLDLFLAAADPDYELVAVTNRRDPKVREGVRVVPFMPPDRLQRLLLAADAFVLPSRAEGFPLTLQEALLGGLPCVVTRVPGFERYLGDSDVIYVAPDPAAIREALLRLATSPAEREVLGRRAREAGERSFGLDRFVSAYEQLYAELRSADGR
jgi:glycosyltransferase involved in cell wall biosynthesis